MRKSRSVRPTETMSEVLGKQQIYLRIGYTIYLFLYHTYYLLCYEMLQGWSWTKSLLRLLFSYLLCLWSNYSKFFFFFKKKKTISIKKRNICCNKTALHETYKSGSFSMRNKYITSADIFTSSNFSFEMRAINYCFCGWSGKTPYFAHFISFKTTFIYL